MTDESRRERESFRRFSWADHTEHRCTLRPREETVLTITFRKGTGKLESSASVVGSESRCASTHAAISLHESGNQLQCAIAEIHR